MKRHKRKKQVELTDFDGKPVAVSSLKEKKADISSEIKAFLDGPKTYEDVKYILCRLGGQTSPAIVKKTNLSIFGLPLNAIYLKHGHNKPYEFVIHLQYLAVTHTYFLNSMTFCSFGWFNVTDLDTSLLKQDLRHAIFEWCRDNLDHVIVLEPKMTDPSDP